MAIFVPAGNFFPPFFSPFLTNKKKIKVKKKKEFAAFRVAIMSATRWKGNKLFKGWPNDGLMYCVQYR